MSISQADIDELLTSGEAAAAVAGMAPPTDAAAEVRPSGPGPELARPELARILRMRVPIIVTLAERHLPVGEVLKLNVGSLLEFDRPADADMDVLVNNRRIGRGRPVKVGENFGLRLTAVGGLEGTIQALGG